MKSFSEYIKESYSFRLGGSHQKGFDQNKPKTFAQLEKGDLIFSWNTGAPADTAGVYTIYNIRKWEHSRDDGIDIELYVDEYGHYTIRNDEEINSDISIQDNGTLFISTNIEKLIEVVEDEQGFKITKASKEYKEEIPIGDL